MERSLYTCEVGGKILTAEFNNLADQAHGAVTVKYGNTVILATAVMSKHAKDGMNYFPLTVDYEERFYAAGQILGSQYLRREGRPSEEAILSGRIVDRTIRPLFPQHLRNEVQVIITVLALDEDDPDVLAVLAASLALGTSEIPWNGPASAIRIGKTSGMTGFDVNPSYLARENKDYECDILACGKDGTINMIEVGAKEVSENVLAEAFERANVELNKLQEFQKKIIAERGKAKRSSDAPTISDSLKQLFDSEFASKLDAAVFSGAGKDGIHALEDAWLAKVAETLPDESGEVARHFIAEQVNDILHREAINNSRRPDGRSFDEIRPLHGSVGGISPVLHGTGIFFRGGTHVLSVLTLGGPQDSLIVDSMEEQEVKKRFMHHYNFPPFSSGETGRMGGTNRRMIGHGALAEKALKAVIPDIEKFPYTIRLVSECMASNGSTSMGSVCAGTLALMDGGVPIKSPVAGIAVGLMMETHDRYAVLTDIQGPEDEHGDMDFKVAGTKDGITAVQLDVKVDGVPIKILREALEKARAARVQILKVIEDVLPSPRKDISSHAPKIVVTKIKPEQIGLVIGGGGKTINEIRDATGAEIDIEDDGTVFITGHDGSAEKAQKIIEEMTREYKAGEKFDGVVTRIMDFGAFVKIGHNTEGLVHISEIAPFRIERVTDVLKEGEVVPVIIKEIDEKHRINLSIKAIDKSFAERKGIKPGVTGENGTK